MSFRFINETRLSEQSKQKTLWCALKILISDQLIYKRY